MAHAGEEITNPRTGQRMIFRQTARDTGGALLQIETINPPGPPEPEHIHVRQGSSAKVLAGALHFRVGGDERIVRAGETIVIPPDTPHCFWNDGPADAHAIQEFSPALETEFFFETFFGLARDGKLDEKGMPSLLQMAVIASDFRDVIRPASPPWPLIRMLSWILGPVARARGYRSVYPQDRHEVPAASSP